MTKYITSLCEQHKLKYISSCEVGGGDINASYSVDTDSGRYFLKLNSATLYPKMFEKEADGLKALQQASFLKIPAPIATGIYENQQYLLMEWMEKVPASKDFWRAFAAGLVQLHKITQPSFGWSSSNYIGCLVQHNKPAATWEEFYTTQRILPLVEKLYNKHHFSKADIEAAGKVCTQFNGVFPHEEPALIHGDLWAGNYFPVQSDNDSNAVAPSIFDPAAHFGHREMDLGMTLLFGGFDNNFYNEYNEMYPLDPQWKRRIPLTQLYPLLVHAVLFGGIYIMRCRQIFKEWS